MPVFGQYIRVGEVHGRCKGTDYVNAEAIEAFSSIVRHCRQGKGQGAQSYVSPVQVRPSVNRSRIPCGHEVLILGNQVLAIKSGWISHSDKIIWEYLWREKNKMSRWNDLDRCDLVQFVENQCAICFQKAVRKDIGINPKFNACGKWQTWRRNEPSVQWSQISVLEWSTVCHVWVDEQLQKIKNVWEILQTYTIEYPLPGS